MGEREFAALVPVKSISGVRIHTHTNNGDENSQRQKQKKDFSGNIIEVKKRAIDE